MTDPLQQAVKIAETFNDILPDVKALRENMIKRKGMRAYNNLQSFQKRAIRLAARKDRMPADDAMLSVIEKISNKHRLSQILNMPVIKDDEYYQKVSAVLMALEYFGYFDRDENEKLPAGAPI